jgi:hypothetical protein
VGGGGSSSSSSSSCCFCFCFCSSASTYETTCSNMKKQSGHCPNKTLCTISRVSNKTG